MDHLLIISPILALKVLQKLKSLNFLSVLLNRTTDISVSEKKTMSELGILLQQLKKVSTTPGIKVGWKFTSTTKT